MLVLQLYAAKATCSAGAQNRVQEGKALCRHHYRDLLSHSPKKHQYDYLIRNSDVETADFEGGASGSGFGPLKVYLNLSPSYFVVVGPHMYSCSSLRIDGLRRS